MRKRIAVFICTICFDNQRRILEGILDAAKEQQVDVFVFTCYLSYFESELNKQGAYNILYLPDLKTFDGIIIHKNTIQHKAAANDLVERIRKSGVLTVSIDEEIEGMSYVGVSNYHAQKLVLSHMLSEHRVSRINYVTGWVNTKEGMERFKAYREILVENGIAYNESRVYYGSYDMDSGRMAVMRFVEASMDMDTKTSVEMPEVIVCANDGMAVGAMEQLKELGYRVPEDIAVVGFDNDELAALYVPALTTVDKRQETIGRKALELILSKNLKKPVQHIVTPRLAIRNSCGCSDNKNMYENEINRKYAESSVRMQKVADNIKNMSIDMAAVETIENLYDTLKNYIDCMGSGSFYLCMCDEGKIFPQRAFELGGISVIEEVNSTYTNEVTIPVAYEKGGFTAYSAFGHGRILPDQCCRSEKSSFYIVVPIYCQNWCFGYSVAQNNYLPLDNELYYLWTINIGIAFENVRKKLLLKQMVNCLNSVWAYDGMTNVYNRAGFLQKSEKLLRIMQEKDAEAFMIFLDLDGLKGINDIWGHECGDRYICAMADILKKVVSDRELLMRYGGDEFVIFGENLYDHYALDCEKRIRKLMQQFNKCGTVLNTEYRGRMVASIGISRHRARDIHNLWDIMEAADKKMYEDKKLHKGL